MLFNIQPLRMWVHKVLPVVYDDSLSYYEVLEKTVRKLNEVIDLTDEQTKFIQEFSDNLTKAINEWEEGLSTEWTNYKKRIDAEWENYKSNTDEDIEIWKKLKEVEIERAVAEGIYAFAEYFEGLKNQAVDAADRAGDEADRAEAAADEAAENAVEAVMPTLQGIFDNRYAFKSAIGSPLVASTAAEMTDTNKIYVYVGDEAGYTSGNWYYYDGTAWVSGGVYNSVAVVTDTTLTQSGVPADAKVTGDEITDLKSAIAYTNETSGYRVNVEWESGAIDGTTGAESENANYSRTVNYIPTTDADYVDGTLGSFTLILFDYENGSYVRKASKYVNAAASPWAIDKQYGYFRISGGTKIANHPENLFMIYKYTKAQKNIDATKLTIIGKYKAPMYMGDGNIISWKQYASNTTLTMPHDTQIIFEGYMGAANYIYTNDVFTVAQSASETTVDGDTITGNNFAIIYNISTGTISITAASTYTHADINEVVLFEVAWTSFVSGLLVDYVIRRKYESNIKRLEAVESVINSGMHLPDYWLTYLETKISDVQDKDIEIGNHGDGFIWVTDLHYNTNDGNSAGACEYIIGKSSVNNVIIGGDICSGSNDGKSACFKQILNCRDAYRSINPFYLRGNHDNNTEISSPSEEKAISDSELYGIILKPIEEKIVNPNKTLHYYFDNEVQKIRYICLDTGHPDTNVISDEQITWMQGLITGLTSGWTVIVLTHQFYSTVGTMDGNGTKILAGLNAIYDTVNAVIACVICGHSHADYLETTSKGFPVICTTCDVRGGQSSSVPLVRTAGTYTEQAFDVFHIDTMARKIYATRIGAGSDRETTY